MGLGQAPNHSEPQFSHLYNGDNQHCPLPRRLTWVCTENTYAMQSTWFRTSLSEPRLCSSPPCPPPWVPGTLGGLQVLRKQSPGFGYSKSSSRCHSLCRSFHCGFHTSPRQNPPSSVEAESGSHPADSEWCAVAWASDPSSQKLPGDSSV